VKVPRDPCDTTMRAGSACTGRAVTARVSRWAVAVLCGVLLSVTAAPVAAQSESGPITNEYRLTAFPYYPLGKGWTGIGYVGYVYKPDASYESYYLASGAFYQPTRHFQFWSVLIFVYTDKWTASNTLELRPFVGVKFMGATSGHVRYYNWTRYEFRETKDLDTGSWTDVRRIRNQSRIDVPLAAGPRAWTPKTWYAFTDIEPIWRSDTRQIDPVRWRVGLGYVTPRVLIEIQYFREWTRPDGGPLTYTNNIFRLNFKILTKGGILAALRAGEMD
jgi:hypothetical protein